MDWALVVVLQVMFQPSLSDLFTVEAERTSYQSEFGGDVVMGCRFQPKTSNPHHDLKVTWHRITSSSFRKVYHMDNGVEKSESQDPDYRDRVKLLTDELKDGWAKLQLSRLRVNDSGIYQCLVNTDEGADYKDMTLSVIAPYKAVTKGIEVATVGEQVQLSCQSEGYPRSSVTWQDGRLRRISPTTAAVSTPDQLFKVTGYIDVLSSDKNNYTCIFDDGNSATFHIPDDLPVPHTNNNASVIALTVILIAMAVLVFLVHRYRRQKGFSTHNTRNLLVDGRGRSVSTAECVQVNKEEEVIHFNEGCTEENLGAFVKDQYSEFSLSADVKRHLDTFGVEELPQRLQNNKGQPESLQALLPEAGETLFLEGFPASGKTTVAHILVYCWTEGPTHGLSNVLDLSPVRLLLYVDCSKAKGNLFQEVRTQLSLAEKISTEDNLRTVLTGSSETLLLLDGYREGNQVFDESLKKFLSERRGCRVLVTACPGHCPMLKDTVGTGRLLQLQTQPVKY